MILPERGYFTRFKIYAKDVKDADSKLKDAYEVLYNLPDVYWPWQAIANGKATKSNIQKLRAGARRCIFLYGRINLSDHVGWRGTELALIKVGDKYYRILKSYAPDFTQDDKSAVAWAKEEGEWGTWLAKDWTAHAEEIDGEIFEKFEAVDVIGGEEQEE